MRVLLLWLYLAGRCAAQQGAVEEAMQLARQGQLREAAALLTTWTRQQPGDAEAQYRLGVVLLRLGDAAEAGKRLELAASLDAANPFPWLGLADARLRSGDREGALQAANEAEKRGAEVLPVWKALSLFYRRSANPLGEARALQQVIAVAPGDRAARIALVELLLRYRAGDGAVAAAAKALEALPGDAELLRLHGLALYGVGRKEEAVRTFVAAIDAAPGQETSYASLETLLGDAGELRPKIVQRLEAFRKLQPASPIGPYLLALAQGGGNSEPLLREAVRIEPGFWPGWYELGRLLQGKGQGPDAAAAFEKVLSLQASHAPSHFALAQIYAASGEAERAKRHRLEHHRLRQAERAAEQERSAARLGAQTESAK